MRFLLRGLYTAGHVFVLVLFAAGYLGRFVDPYTIWWLQIFAIVLPAAAALLFVLTLVSAAIRIWPLFTVSVLALLMFGLRYAAAVGGTFETVEPTITVVTFNTGGGENMVKGGDHGLRNLIDEVEPDILCLQEFWIGYWETSADGRTHARADEILDSLGYRVIAPPTRAAQRRPSPIITRFEIDETSVVKLSSLESQERAGTLLRAQFSSQGRSFVIYNLHLQSFTEQRPWREGASFNPRAWVRFLRRTNETFLQRADEAREIGEILEQEKLPFLLCGDFNSTPHQWTYARLAAGLTDVYRASGGFWGPTYPSSSPLVRIDFILASEEWSTGDVDVGGRLPSDHRSVVARLRLDGPAMSGR